MADLFVTGGSTIPYILWISIIAGLAALFIGFWILRLRKQSHRNRISQVFQAYGPAFLFPDPPTMDGRVLGRTSFPCTICFCRDRIVWISRRGGAPEGSVLLSDIRSVSFSDSGLSIFHYQDYPVACIRFELKKRPGSHIIREFEVYYSDFGNPARLKSKEF